MAIPSVTIMLYRQAMFTRRSLVRILINVLLDGLAAFAAVPLAVWIADPVGPVGRDALLSPGQPILWWLVGSLALVAAGVPFRLAQQYWRFAGLTDLVGVAGGSALGAALFALLLTLGGHTLPSPTFPVVHGLCLMLLLGAPRVAYRLMQGRPRPGRGEEAEPRPVVLVGGGDGADLFLRALSAERAAPRLRVIGLLALGSRQTGRRIQGCPILGPVAEAATVLERLRQEGRCPATLVITGEDLDGPTLSTLMDVADEMGIAVRRAPRPTTLQAPSRATDLASRAELRGGTAMDRANPGMPPIELKPVLIEDLLNRAQVPLDRDGMARLVQGRRVLVTGAGGTIGSELARQVSGLGPEELVLLDNGEYALWQIDLELSENAPHIKRHTLIADVRDTARIRDIFERMRPELVFHAAALKHVPMVEANPLEGLLTNVFGTQNVADAARAVGCRAMVFISTDKAVNPTSLMGASKRLAEMYCQALDIGARGAMRCVTVRFGNVLGSTGSVVPLFRRQLERGGPLTVTHPDMRRYFMTVREAVSLVLQASVVGTNGLDSVPSSDGTAPLPLAARGEGGIFVLDMGEPVKIVDLARRMIRLAGLVPDRDVAIRFTGLRPGEKLFEELFHGKEPPVPTGYPGLLMAAPRTADPAIVGRAIEEIAAASRTGQQRLALTVLARMVPEFEHNAAGEVGTARA
jgi:FlaA1/EpsC-like NDP-sugar epimerase